MTGCIKNSIFYILKSSILDLSTYQYDFTADISTFICYVCICMSI